MSDRKELVFKLDILRRYLENFDPNFFVNAVNHEAFAEDLGRAVEMLKNDVK